MPTASPATESREYEARHLLVLEGLEAVRKRPAMYIGSTDTRGLMHCLWEIIDNAVDEALGGYGKEIFVTLRPDGGISVQDHGRGIPVDIEPRTGLSGVEVVFTKLHAGGKFGAGSYNATGGLHGVGSSVVNALSSRLDVEVDRNSATWAMSFRRGVPGTFDGPGTDGEVHTRRWPPQDRTGAEGYDRHSGDVLARPADLPPRCPAVVSRPPRPRPADKLLGAGTWRSTSPTRVRQTSSRRPIGTRGVSRSSANFLRPTQRVTDVIRLRGHRSIHRDRPDAGRRGPHGAGRRRAGPRDRYRCPLG